MTVGIKGDGTSTPGDSQVSKGVFISTESSLTFATAAAIVSALLGELYRGASSFLLPSILEGFSITPLEALVLGTPPVVSDIPVHKEVVGEAFSVPLDVTVWADRIQAVERDGGAALKDAQAAALSKWTWKKAAEAMSCVLERLDG